MDPIDIEDADPPANVLLLHDTHCDPDGCDRLRQLDDDVPTAELRVAFATADPPYDGAFDGDRSSAPEKLGIVSVGDVLRSTSGDGGPDFSAPIPVDAVSDPTDISAIGVSVSCFCERWGPAPEQLTVCFHSLDALLRHTDPETVFEFTYYLNKRLSDVGALAHFHLDPTKHDDRVVVTFGDIFDEVIADDSADPSFSEATDEEIARLFEPDETEPMDWADGLDDEATDEEIEQSLGF